MRARNIADTFTYLLELAENTQDELHGRYFWKAISDGIKEKAILQDEPIKLAFGFDTLMDTQCGVSTQALWVALLGPDFTEKTATLKSKAMPIDADNLGNQFIENQTLLLSSQDFIVYEFDLGNPHLLCEAQENRINFIGGHNFIVVQYLDNLNTIRYRFLQSYFKEYSLLQYFNKIEVGELNNDLSASEFETFLNALASLNKIKKWSDAMPFYKKYFGVPHDEYQHYTVEKNSKFAIHYAKTTTENVDYHRNEFIKLKKSGNFPHIIMGSIVELPSGTHFPQLIEDESEERIDNGLLCLLETYYADGFRWADPEYLIALLKELATLIPQRKIEYELALKSIQTPYTLFSANPSNNNAIDTATPSSINHRTL